MSGMCTLHFSTSGKIVITELSSAIFVIILTGQNKRNQTFFLFFTSVFFQPQHKNKNPPPILDHPPTHPNLSINCFPCPCFCTRIARKQPWMPSMEETILVGDDLMMGPPSPIVPPEIASHVLQGVDLCDGILRNLFLCLQINDIEPFCQDEIALYKQCAERRDKEIRIRLQDSEFKLGSSMPLDAAKERSTQLEGEVTSLERRLILASGVQGIEGFRTRWSLHGRLTDSKKRLESLKQGMNGRKR